MKKYKLIKEYPGSPKLGSIHEPNGFGVIASMFFEGEFNKYKEFWEEVIEKDYEILSWISPSDKLETIRHSTFSELHVKIRSVKRLSDGEIFTLGDNTNHGKILNIYFGKNITFHCDKDDEDPWLEDLKQVKQPLFTTEDGVNIFEGDWYCYFRFHSWTCDMSTANEKFYSQDKFSKNRLYFSTKEKAEEYILINKPCLSLNDLLKFFLDTYVPFKKNESSTENINTEDLEKLVKQKLNNKN